MQAPLLRGCITATATTLARNRQTTSTPPTPRSCVESAPGCGLARRTESAKEAQWAGCGYFHHPATAGTDIDSEKRSGAETGVLPDPRGVGPKHLEEPAARPPCSPTFRLFEGFLEAEPIVVRFVPPPAAGVERTFAAWGAPAWCAGGSLAGAELLQGTPQQQHFKFVDGGHQYVLVRHGRGRWRSAASCSASVMELWITTAGPLRSRHGWRRAGCRSRSLSWGGRS
jgi:hypothetical protein